MTPVDAWFYRQMARSREIIPDGVPGAMEQSPEIACTILLMPFDGMRALVARCLEIDGVMIQLQTDASSKA